MARVAAVHVVSEVVGLSSQVQKLLPCVNVVNIDITKATEEETDGKQLPQLLKNAEILLADPPVITKALYSVPTLKWAHCTWAGVDSIFKTLDSSKPLPSFVLTRNGQGFSMPMSEYVIGQIIAKERHFHEIKEDQKEKNMGQKWKSYRSLSDLVIGILGVGQIGSEVAKMCKTFGMTVWGMVSSKPDKNRETNSHVDHFCWSLDGLRQMLSNCDYVCNILPSTSSTRGLLNGDILEACKQKKSIFINVGRGDIIEEEFLLKALKSEWLGGAILDVFTKEPLDEKSELWSLPNVIITPHVSAVSFSGNVGALFKTNFDCFNEGKDLHYKVNWDKAY